MEILEEQDESLWLLFTNGISSFGGLMRDGRWVDVLLRVGIFIGLVFVVHAIFVWALHAIIIPLIQRYVMDSILEELKKRLVEGQVEKYTITWGQWGGSKDWTSIFK